MPHAVLCVGDNTEGYDNIPARRTTCQAQACLGLLPWSCCPGHAARAGPDVTRPGPRRHRGGARPGSRSALSRLAQPSGYLTVTLAPAPSRAARALSALSLLTFSSTVLGAPSTRSLASFRPRLVRLRTSLMTWIFLSPAALRMTSNSSCSSG